MIGYATDESPELLPLTMVYSTQLALKLKELMDSKELPWLRPDAKTQVTMKYQKDKNGVISPVSVETVLIST